MKYFFLFLNVLFTISLTAQNTPLWLRHAAISPNGQEIAFTYMGDIYKVSAKGGQAQQLTIHQAHDFKPVWSKDGQSIAFASDRYGNFDIYVMKAIGGAAERLTFHSNNETPYSFSSNDASIYFGALRMDDFNHRQHPHRSQSELYSVPAKGGRVMQVLTLPAESLQSSKDGDFMLYHDKKGGENEFRKHHTSSITRDIWKYDTVSGEHLQLTTHKAEDRHPVLTEDEEYCYFLSERSGTFNVFKMALANPENVIQVSNFDTHPVRFLSYGSGTLAYTYNGELYTQTEGEDPVKLSIQIVTQEKSNADKFISVKSGVEEMAISPSGKEIAFITRGEVFVTSVEESFTKRLTNTADRERFVTWGPEGKSVVYSSERNGKWSLYETKKVREEEPFFYASTLLEEQALLTNTSDNYMARFSPDGKKMAYVKDRRNIVVKDLASGEERMLLNDSDLFHMRDGDKYFRWSPDSKWLLVDWNLSLNNSEVLLLAADGSKRLNLNESGYYDSSPKWVNEGKQMIWFSNKNGLKSYATSGRSESDVYMMFFDQKEWDIFNLSEEDYKLHKAVEEAKKEKEKEKKEDEEKDKKDDKEKEKKEEVKALAFDWEDMDERVARLTIHSSRLGDAVLSKKGDHLYYLSRFEGKMNLWSTNLRTKETKMALKLGANSGSLQWDSKRENLYLLSGGSISKIDVEKGKKKPVKISGEMAYDANAERLSMYDHVTLRTKAIFYHPDFHGIDWEAMSTNYRTFVPHTSNSYEFSEVLSELLGELNVSHAGSGPARNDMKNKDATAALGIFWDYAYEGVGIKVAEVIKGGPLDKADISIKEGSVIEKIDGESIQADVDFAQYLNRKAGQFTLLEVIDPNGQKRDTITIKPISLGEESRLLYKRWVKQNEEEVDKMSNGRLGYVHIPGMGDGPYRSIYEDMMGKYFDKEGMIVDTRFNGGGDLVADLAMFFTGVPFISYETEAKVVGGEPTSRWTKPTLALINESQYSDGHCFACGYKDLKIGKLVGMPVPGTCSFAGWERLPDGTFWGVVPVSAKDINGQWMENNQTDPDVLVKNMPGVIDQGMDQQLQKAVQVMLEDLKE
jgi:tricorn protease